MILKIQDGGRLYVEKKIEKSPYLGKGMTDRHKI